MEKKICTKCGKEKWEDQFRYYENRSEHAKLDRICKKCRNEYVMRNRRKYVLPKLYGITLKDFDDMLERQDGRCAICGKKGNDNKNLCVDHNHKTGRVRGLLCSRCNIKLGLVEYIAYAEKMIAYLNKYK